MAESIMSFQMHAAQSLLREQIVARALKTGRFHAVKLGMSVDDAEDCATDFAVRMLEHESKIPVLGGGESLCRRWWNTCALNHAINHRLALTRRNNRECAFPTEEECMNSYCDPAELTCSRNPEARTLQNEEREQINYALSQLDPTSRDVFLRHHIDSESAANIALTSRRSRNAIEQLLWRTRQKLRRVLAKSIVD